MHQQLIARYRQARKDPALCVLEGLHAIKHALRFDAEIIEMHSHDQSLWPQLAHDLAPDLAARIEARQQLLPTATYNELAPKPPHTGIIAIARRPRVDVAQLLLARRKGPIVILDHPTHPGNTGAVIRTCAAAGASAVLCTGPIDPWHPSILRASAGLHFALHVAAIEEGEVAQKTLIGLDAEGEPLNARSIDDDALLVFGSERRGLGQGMRDQLSQCLRLPMQKGVSSLNLAASVAVVLYHWRLKTSPD